jgi:DNA polymerase-3 subunit beta
MQVTCTQEKLSKALSIVGRTVANRATLPVLSNILMSADNGRLKLTATDLEIGVSTWIGGQAEQNGALTVPARLLTDFVTNNADSKIELKVVETTLHLSSDHFEANIKGIEASEFPTIPEVSGDPLVTISTKEFVEALRQVLIAPAVDDTRPVLAGVLFAFRDGTLNLVATDSYRLAEKKLPLSKKVEQSDLIVPSRSLNELLRIIGSVSGVESISISVNENQILFVVGDTQVVSRLIEGSFPSYEQIIPKATATKAVIDTAEMTGTVKMAALFARESANNIKLEFKEKQLITKSVSAQVGDNVSTMPADLDGPAVEVAFNAKYLLDFLSVVGDKSIQIGINDRQSAAVFKPLKDGNFLYIIMPLRVED